MTYPSPDNTAAKHDQDSNDYPGVNAERESEVPFEASTIDRPTSIPASDSFNEGRPLPFYEDPSRLKGLVDTGGSDRSIEEITDEFKQMTITSREEARSQDNRDRGQPHD